MDDFAVSAVIHSSSTVLFPEIGRLSPIRSLKLHACYPDVRISYCPRNYKFVITSVENPVELWITSRVQGHTPPSYPHLPCAQVVHSVDN